MESRRCVEAIWVGYHRRQCKKNASCEVAGNWYCSTHSPIKKAERDKAREEEWRAKMDAVEASSRRRAAEVKACAGFTTEELESGVMVAVKREDAEEMCRRCNKTRYPNCNGRGCNFGLALKGGK